MLAGDLIPVGGEARDGPKTFSEYLTPSQVAKVLNVTRQTVLNHFGNCPGVVDLSPPSLKRGVRRKRLLRIPQAVLNRYLYEHRVRG